MAEACGIARQWRDVTGQDHTVRDATLEAILAALGYHAQSSAQIAESLAMVAQEKAALPLLLAGDAGETLELPHAAQSATARDADGYEHALMVEGRTLALPQTPGYYDLTLDEKHARLAVAPARCPALAPHQRLSGLSLQIPSLTGARQRAFGNLGELAEFAEKAAKHGIDALAISPLHALFSGEGERFSPYSPSSRLHRNAIMGEPELVGLAPIPDEPVAALIDWQSAVPHRFKALRRLYAALPQQKCAAIAGTCDASMRQHAVFDALYRHFSCAGETDWRNWPERYRTPGSSAARKLDSDNPEQVGFHVFLQWLTRESQRAVQKRAKDVGMEVGLIGDLAVGVDPAGSDCWAMGDAMLRGLSIGAPPDTFSKEGQNWGLTTFSPTGLAKRGFAPFIAMLRSAFDGCGGLRVDHAFGLARLWVIPEGAKATEGAYLSFPQDTLLRLVALEAYRANAIVIAEDLGTAPFGFTSAIEKRGIMGMQVLWFQRAADGGFIGAQDYSAGSVAMTGTHDTPTVAGWWTGRDLDWAEKLNRLPDGVEREKADAIRDWDRGLLWATMGSEAERPAPTRPDAAVDAAIAHCAATPSPLAIVPIEDVMGETEQPNLPGTIDTHPNWRRRIASYEVTSPERASCQRLAKLAQRKQKHRSDTVPPPG